MTTATPPKYPASVFWQVWIGILASAFYYQFRDGGGFRFEGGALQSTGYSFFVVFAVAHFVAASVVRWIVIPKANERRRVLIYMVVGLALSEAITFYGIYLFAFSEHETKMLLFSLSILSVVQFAPFYCRNIEHANQSADPTLSSGTTGAGHEPRHR
jgi:hypothetical protein